MHQPIRFVQELRRAALGVALLAATAAANETTRISVTPAGANGNGPSWIDGTALSADGRVVAFSSDAANLVAGDTNGCQDAFVHDRDTGLTTRVSVSSSGAQTSSSGGIVGMSISADGRFVAFASDASNLVAGDSNGCTDVFVHDRATGATERLSVDSAGNEGDSDSFFPLGISADGQVVAFHGYASNLVAGDTNDVSDVFVHDRATGITARVSVDSSGVEGDDYSSARALSADGTLVAFDSEATNLVAGDGNGVSDVFVHDRATGITRRVSVASDGTEGDDESFDAALSADGQLVAYSSVASNFAAGDANSTTDVFVHDRSTGITTRVSVDGGGGEAQGTSQLPSLSGDGRCVAFRSSAADLVTGDTNGVDDLFVHELATGAIERVSVDSAGGESDANSYYPTLNADGRAVAFYSFATDLVAGDTNATYDVFVHDRCVDAGWSNYGVGFAGTNGIPTLVAQADPVLGTTLAVDLGSSANAATVAWVMVGTAAAQLPTSKGGDLLVLPNFALIVALPVAGTTIFADLPDDEALCGVEFFAQALELDAGAANGVSFTAGIQLVLGR